MLGFNLGAPQRLPGELEGLVSISDVNSAMVEATSETSIEGVDKFTYIVPTTGIYRIIMQLVVTQASDAATSHTIVPLVQFTPIVGVPKVSDIMIDSGASQGTLNGKTLNQAVTFSSNRKCVAGTNFVGNINHTVVGAKTAGVGRYQVTVTFERV